MQYSTGSVARVFLLKFEDGDVVMDTLTSFAKKERLKTATILFIGALKEGVLVTGPKRCVIPPEPNQLAFAEGWEAMGIGTLFTNKKGPQIHIHSAMGKDIRTLTGCLRGSSKVFCVIEAVVFELKGIKASKAIDPKTGLNLLKIL